MMKSLLALLWIGCAVVGEREELDEFGDAALETEDGRGAGVEREAKSRFHQLGDTSLPWQHRIQIECSDGPSKEKKCLYEKFDENDKAKRGKLEIGSCDATKDNTKAWTKDNGMLKSARGFWGFCLTADSSHLDMIPCDGSNPLQQWTFEKDFRGGSVLKITNQDMCYHLGTMGSCKHHKEVRCYEMPWQRRIQIECSDGPSKEKKCLYEKFDENGKAKRGELEIGSCDATKDNTKAWTKDNDMLKSARGFWGFCLTARSEDSSFLDMKPCDGSNPLQRWTFEKDFLKIKDQDMCYHLGTMGSCKDHKEVRCYEIQKT